MDKHDHPANPRSILL